MPSRAGTLPFLAALLAFAALLAWRSRDEACWSDWAVGDAQALQTLRHWKEDGFLFHKGLFIPSGYSKTTRYLDEPGLRQHAHGISPWSAPGVGPRLHYTHYPAGYLLPTYALYAAGLSDHRVLGMAQALVSLGAVWLWFLALGILAGPLASALGCLFYLSSPMFLGFAHSLANQPLDDLLRAAAVLGTLLGTRRALAAAWGCLLLLSASSLDSVPFVLAWILGWDLLSGRRRPGLWALFLAAPALAFSLQFLQNAWYLGAADALRDAAAVLGQKSALGGTGPWTALAATCRRALPLLERPLAALALLPAALWILRRIAPASLRALGLLFACGAAFALLLPRAGNMDYQGRQMMPCAALLVGAAGAAFWRALVAGAGGWRGAARLGTLLLFCGMAWGGSVARAAGGFASVPRLVRGSSDIRMARALGERFRGDRVYFSLGAFSDAWTLPYVPGYPQVYALMEHYAGGPVLGFEGPERLAEDLACLWRRSDFPFTAVLLANGEGDVDGVWEALRRRLPSARAGRPPRQGMLLPTGRIVWVSDLTGGLPPR